MAEKVLKIDQRYYQRQVEKKKVRSDVTILQKNKATQEPRNTRTYNLIQLDITERQPAGTKKETREYYNYGIKKYLTRDYQKPKTRSGPQKKQQTQKKSQKQILVAETISSQKKNRQVTVLKKQDIKVKITHILIF